MNLSDIIEDACSLLEASAQEKGLALRCQIIDRIDLDGDLRLLQRMVANLIDNAIKYTDNGSIELVLRKTDAGNAEISISDTGVGISVQDQPYIFDRFYRCDPSRSQTGAGLGLSFARAVARAHGGEIVVASRPSKGTTFIVNLPA